MKRNKSFTLLAVVLVLLSATTWAGGQVETASDQGKTVITVAAGAVGKELDLAKKSAEEYMNLHQDVEIRFLETPDLSTDRLGLYLQFFESQSSEVDIYQVDVVWPGDLAEHFEDLNSYGASSRLDNHFPAIVSNNTVNGNLVAMPWYTDGGLLYYRKDLLDKYGYSAPPRTWDEMEQIAKVVQEGERKEGNQDFWGFVWQGNAYEGLTCDALEWVASHGGGFLIEQDGSVSINNPAAVKALNRAASWVGSISPEGILAFAEEDARKVFQGKNAMFMRNWPYCYRLGSADDSPVKGLFGVQALPGDSIGQSAATLGGWQLSLSRYSENKDAAADFIFYMTGKEVQKMRAIEGSKIPTMPALFNDSDIFVSTPIIQDLDTVFTQAVARPSTLSSPHYAEVSRAFYTTVHDVLSGKITAKDAVEIMEMDIKDLLDK